MEVNKHKEKANKFWVLNRQLNLKKNKKIERKRNQSIILRENFIRNTKGLLPVINCVGIVCDVCFILITKIALLIIRHMRCGNLKTFI